MDSESPRQVEYRKYLETPEWQAKRKAALQRAESRCQVCNSKNRLDVHHRTYERVERERDADLTVLCRRCHDLFHGKRKVVRTPNPKPQTEQAKAAKKVQQRYKGRKRKRWKQRPSASVRRQELAQSVLREQREAEAR